MKRGRPRLNPEVRMVPVSISLSPKQYDLLVKHAQHARLSLPEVIRRRLNKKTEKI
jgi:hypothetical protein